MNERRKELREIAERGIAALIELVGVDPSDEAVIETPGRYVRAIQEMTEGYHDDVATHLARTFDVQRADELIVVRDMPFVSLCEHHLMPFQGICHVGYLPHERVLGLSKIARVMHAYARRLQTQERLTWQIAMALEEVSSSVGVVIESQHECMSCRGVRTSGRMLTSALLGKMRTNHAMRDEFFALIRGPR